jgi:hypothetical protein
MSVAEGVPLNRSRITMPLSASAKSKIWSLAKIGCVEDVCGGWEVCGWWRDLRKSWKAKAASQYSLVTFSEISVQDIGLLRLSRVKFLCYGIISLLI